MFSTGNKPAGKVVGWLLAAGAVPVLLLLYFLDPGTSALFPRCPFHLYTGFFCAGCGSQRAIHSLLHLRPLEAMAHNLLILPGGLLIAYHYIHGLLNRLFGWKLPNLLYMKNTPRIILGVVLVFWFLRNLPFPPFNWLSPGS